MIQNLIQLKKSQSDTAVSYFFFNFNDVEKQSASNAVRSLLFQFAQQARYGLLALEQLYHECGSGQRLPSEDKVQSLFRDMMDRIKSKYVILDALDECTDHDRLWMFVRDLVEFKQPGLRVMVTSRRERDIEEQLSRIADHNVNIHSALVDNDISVYVRSRLITDLRLKKWPPSVREEIIEAMVKNGGGMCVRRVMRYEGFADSRIGFGGCLFNSSLFDSASS